MARRFQVEQAKREKIYPKIGIFSPSGGGKTYSSLRLATGMIEEMERLTGKKYEIWLANNEGSRGKYYANEFNYKIIELEPPHEPELYYDLIDYAENSPECGVLIIDSLSKEWAGQGGCVDIANSLGGSFQNAWKIVTPRHRRLMEKLVNSHLTIIATMRGEDQYEVEKDENGKAKLVKLGIGAKQGKDFEYEFTCTFSLDQKTNCAEVFKDNTHLFEHKPPMKLTEQDGINLIRWANESQIEPEKKPTSFEKAEQEQSALKEEIAKIDELAKRLAQDKTKEKELVKLIKQYNNNSANYNKITDIEVAKQLFAEMQKLEG